VVRRGNPRFPTQATSTIAEPSRRPAARPQVATATTTIGMALRSTVGSYNALADSGRLPCSGFGLPMPIVRARTD